MIKLGIREYVRHFWMNLLSVVILSIMMVSIMILVTTVLKQTRLYRLIRPYLGEKGLVAEFMDEEHIGEMQAVDKILMSSNARAGISVRGKRQNVQMSIYDRYVEKYMEPIMKEGRWVSRISGKKGKIAAVISENNLGIGAGDTVKAELTTKEGKHIKAVLYISGVFCDGQKIYSQGFDIDKSDDYREYFNTHSFYQSGEIQLITTKEQLGAYYEKLDRDCTIAFIKYNDSITELQLKYNNMILERISSDIGSAPPGFVKSYTSAKDLLTISKRAVKDMLTTYIPLIISDFVLICICILGIVAVKTAGSVGYYGKLYLCGMRWTYGIRLSGMQMCLNCILSMILAFSMSFIQNRYSVFGRIFIETGGTQFLCMLAVSIVTIGLSVLVSWMIINENTPAEIIRQSKN